MTKLGLGLLGITHPHTSARLEVMLQQADVEVVAVADDHDVIEPFVRHFGIPRRTAAEILADPDIHAVLVHAKSQEMHTLSAAALEAGKAVLVEKPAGQTVEDLEFLARTVARTHGICQVGYNFRFSKAVSFTERILRERTLGEIAQVAVHGACSLNEAASSHLNQPGDMGGALWVIGCHLMDLIIHHFGMPNSVNARVAKFPGKFGTSFQEDAAAAIFCYNDLIVSFDFMSWDPLPWIEAWSVSVYGTKGILHAGPLPARCRLFLKEPAGSLPAGWTDWQQTSFPVAWAATPTDYSPELAEIANRELFASEAKAFLNAVRGQRQVAVSVEQALNISRLIAACYESSRNQGAVIPSGDEQSR